MERLIIKGNSPYIDQIKSAPFVLEAIKSMPLPSDLLAVKETDVFRLRRGLCLPAAACACINKVVGYRLIDDECKNTQLTLGDFYRIMIPFHGRSDFMTRYNGSVEPWKFATEQGDVYHQAAVAFSKGVGVSSLAIGGFESLRQFQELYSDRKESVAMSVSLDNRFVVDHTLNRSPELVRSFGSESYILIESERGMEYRKFENGRHVVFVDNITQDGTVTIYDSFRLPQMNSSDLVIQLPCEVVDRYLNYTTGGASRGILFARNERMFDEYSAMASKVWVPDEIVNKVKEVVSSRVD